MLGPEVRCSVTGGASEGGETGACETVEGWLAQAGLEPELHRLVGSGEGARLTVSLWIGRDPRLVSDLVPMGREVA